MSSFEWMASKGAPLLPKVLPFCVPERMMELKRRPTIYDIRGSGWQLRKRHAPRDQVVPWDRVFFWPHKAVHEITPQELDPPAKLRRKRVAQKGPKLVKAPSPASRTKEVSVKHTMRYQFKRVLRRVKDLADRRTIDAFLGRPSRPVVAAATTTGAAQHAPSPALRALYTLPGTFPDNGAAAAVDAQIEAAAERDEKPPSFVFALVNFGVDAYIAGRKRKRARELDEAEEAGDAKRRRVESDAQAPSRAEARPVAGRPTRNYTTTTGATARTQQHSTATTASRAVRNKPKPTLELCPPPTGPAPDIDPEKLLPPSQARPSRPIAGRSQPKRADTPVVAPRASTPIPTAGEVLSGQPVRENVDQTEPRAPSPSSPSTPTSSRSRSQSRSPSPSSRSSSPSSSSSSSRSPSPEPESDGDFVPGPTMVSMLPPGTRNGKDGNDLYLFPWSIAWDLRASGRPALPRISEPAPVAGDDAPACECTICARAIAARAAAAAATSAPIPTPSEDTLASLLEMSRPKPSGSTELVDDGEETEVESNNGGTDDEDSDADSSA